jgi:AmmeMemoRadiSam system protein A
MNKTEQNFLLNLARETIIAGCKGESPPTITKDSEKLGVFVTLHRFGELRGCVGYIEGFKPLYEAVVDNALSCAFKDHRFLPLTDDEFDGLELEISVLTEPVPGSLQEIEVGKHGVILSQQGRRSVFLPQVAEEQNWNVEQTMNNLALKAGLPEDCWRSDKGISLFESFCFSAPFLEIT